MRDPAKKKHDSPWVFMTKDMKVIWRDHIKKYTEEPLITFMMCYWWTSPWNEWRLEKNVLISLQHYLHCVISMRTFIFHILTYMQDRYVRITSHLSASCHVSMRKTSTTPQVLCQYVCFMLQWGRLVCNIHNICMLHLFLKDPSCPHEHRQLCNFYFLVIFTVNYINSIHVPLDNII